MLCRSGRPGAPSVRVLAAGCTTLKHVHPAGAPLPQTFSLDISITRCAHDVYWDGCMVFRGYAPGACMISNLNFEHCRH